MAGVGTQQQSSVGTSPSGYFDYDAFWQHFNGERTANNLFVLAVDAPEKPIEEVKAKHRSRTLRKRQYKRALRVATEQNFSQAFLK